jgi:hypothetical protein
LLVGFDSIAVADVVDNIETAEDPVVLVGVVPLNSFMPVDSEKAEGEFCFVVMLKEVTRDVDVVSNIFALCVINAEFDVGNKVGCAADEPP